MFLISNIWKGIKNMSSVTQRINEIKQPRGGYIKPSCMEIIEMKKMKNCTKVRMWHLLLLVW